MEVTGARQIEAGTPSIDASIAASTYEIDLSTVDVDFDGGIAGFAERVSIPYTSVRGKRTRDVDLKRAVDGLAVSGDAVLGMTIRNEPPVVRPAEILQEVFGVSDDALKSVQVKKVGVEWRMNEELRTKSEERKRIT